MTNNFSSILFRFIISLSIATIITLISHLGILKLLKLPLFEHLILRAYLINYLEALLIFIFLFIGRNKFKTSMGFIFMGNSFVKFILFFIFFYPSYIQDNQIEKFEFITFFVPYAVCLIVETYFLSKISNNN